MFTKEDARRPLQFVCERSGTRLDVFLKEKLDPAAYSRQRIQHMIRAGGIRVEGAKVKPGFRLKAGQRVRIEWREPVSPQRSDVTFDILHEDEDLLIINKPRGLLVHPRGKAVEDSVVMRVWPQLSAGWSNEKSGGLWRPGVVHRLDRGTSGVLVLAKTPKARTFLSRQFATRQVQKIYWAVVEGVPFPFEGEVEALIGRDVRARGGRQAVTGAGRWSLTRFRVLKPGKESSWVEVKPVTGRTHQIRLILSRMGHPVVGDVQYGAGASEGHFYLHARSITFKHPSTGKKVFVEAEAPKDFMKRLESL